MVSTFSSWEWDPEAWPPTMPISVPPSASIGQGVLSRGEGGRPANQILLITIHDTAPAQPITTALLNQVVSGLAYLVRVVIVHKRSIDRVQAMMEFQTKADAQRVKEHLHGAFIYDNCCRMEIEFAFERVFRLRVVRNDDDTWDFTRVLPPSAVAAVGGTPLKRKAAALFNQGDASLPSKMSRFHIQGDVQAQAPRPPAFYTQLTHHYKGRVCMLYDLNMPEMSPQRLFNLFCLYGNVNRIKFLSSKEGSAMVEMADPAAAERLIHLVSGCPLFGSTITVRFSRQELIVGGTSSRQLANGCLAFADFSADDNNRFCNAIQAGKNRIVPPSKVVHFFNLPLDMGSSDQVSSIFACLHAPEPRQIKIFVKADRARSLNGLLEFSSVGEALDAIAICNHAAVGSSNTLGKKNVLKLCFSINDKLN